MQDKFIAKVSMESIDVINPALFAGPQIHCTFYVVVHSDFGRWLSSTFLPIRYPLTTMSFTTTFPLTAARVPYQNHYHNTLIFMCLHYPRHLLLTEVITCEI